MGLTSIASAYGKIQAGKAQQKAFAAQAEQSAMQATQARVQARSEALKFRRQGVEVLDRIVRNNATINARAGAGGIDPFSGSANSLQQFALAKGGLEFFTAEDNEAITALMGEQRAKQFMHQAATLTMQGNQAMKIARIEALVTLAQSAERGVSLGKGAPSSRSA
tara:strand:- start:13572 stop:14066 length:495 start_codon:yes stop_codon:yes gene_type:complete